ncbi:MAG: hypothetical protein Q9218_003048 [Villophora microphyllina]
MGSPINRGIGEAICQVLASTNKEPMVLFATSRKGEDLGLTPASSKTQLRYPKLDIADPNSIESFAQEFKQDHTKVDVLINNAGTNLDLEYSPAHVKTTLDTNYRGTLKVSGRKINIAEKGA